MAPTRVTAAAPMLKACGLAFALLAARMVIEHHYWNRATDNFYEGLQNQLPPDDDRESSAGKSHRFYYKELPRMLAIIFPLMLLEYQWQCWLERLLPTRPVGSAAFTAQEKEKITDDDDMMEEEVMKRLIAKGKVRPSSIKWVNVLLKWIVDNTLGCLLFGQMFYVILSAGKLQRPGKIWAGFGWNAIDVIVFHIFSISPLVSLIGFAIIPVQHRLPFDAGIKLCWHAFLAAFLAVFMPWLLTTEFMQFWMENWTEGVWLAYNQTMAEKNLTTAGNITLPQIESASMGELR